jgi:hypothetical protein
MKCKICKNIFIPLQTFVWLNWQMYVTTVIWNKKNIGILQSTYQSPVSYQ